MKKILQKIYCVTVCKSRPVIDAVTGRKEIPVNTKIFGFTVKTSYRTIEL